MDGDLNDDPTQPDPPRAILTRALERLRIVAEDLLTAIPLLDQIEGRDRDRLVEALVKECPDVADSVRDLGPAIRGVYGR